MMRQAGFSFVEIIIVVAILGIVATAALPDLFADLNQLDTASEEFVNAVRFARAEAIKTGTPHGIEADTTTNRLRVYSLSASTPTYTVYHPIDKKLYAIDLKSDNRTANVSLLSANFTFNGGFSSTSLLAFNNNGAPKYSNAGTDYMLTSATITLAYKNQQRILSIAPMTGRVTIQ